MPTHFCRAPTFVSLSLRITWHKYQFGGETSCGHSLDFCLIESKESYDLSFLFLLGESAGRASLGGRTRRLAEIEHSQNHFWCNCALFRLFNNSNTIQILHIYRTQVRSLSCLVSQSLSLFTWICQN